MDNTDRLDRLAAKAKGVGFEVKRERAMMVIEKHGFQYMFQTEIDDITLTRIIQDAESFMAEIMRMKS